jgi:hypothetical protein
VSVPAKEGSVKMPQRVSNEQVVSAYRATGSIWKAAKQLGICGQSLWERLHAIGYRLGNTPWTEEEIEELKLLAKECSLGEIARRLGRPYAGTACKASELHLRLGIPRAKKIKRGSGLTKEVMARHVKALSVWGGSVRQYCIQRGIELETFVHVLQRENLPFWESYVKSHSDLSIKQCPECGRDFVPMTAKQLCCSRKCSSTRRTDTKYFGGKRKMTIGLDSGVCQLCEKEKTLSSHHVFGKENDPDNEFLIALCTGCHHLLGMLASRADVGNPKFFENIIALALARRHATPTVKPLGYHVYVDIEELNSEDFEQREASFLAGGGV